MPDLNGHSILQVAALRRMTSDPELAARCEAWLRDRGALQARHFLTRWFVGLAAGFLLFMWMEFDEIVDAEMPTMRLLGWSGAIVIALIGGFFGFILFLLSQMHSWWWRGGMVLVLILVAACQLYWDRLRYRL